MKPDDIVKRYEKLDSERGTWKQHIQEVAEYMIPGKATVITQGVLGAKRMSKIFDSTALRALETFANGLYGHMTSPAAPWFELTTKNKNLANRPNVKRWLRDTSGRMHDALNSSNFGKSIHEVYTDLGWAGTAPIQVDEGKRNILAFSAFAPGKVCVQENEYGLVDTIYRCEPMTAREIIRKWGETKPSEQIRNAAKKDITKKFDVIHAVLPREDVERFFDRTQGSWWPKTGALNMPIASFYIEKETKNVLNEGGYNEMPIMVPRWNKDSEEEYGRSPGMTALPDVKMLNAMSKSAIKGMQKIMDPPLLVPDEMRLFPLRLTPGGLNYYKTGAAEPHPLYVPDKIQLALEYEEQRRQSIEQCFYVDLFMLLQQQKKQMTLGEVYERVEEKLMILGPSLGRLQSELYDPLLSRVFWIMYRGGYIEPVPRELIGEGLEVEYISKLAMAMRLFEVQAMQKGVAFASSIYESKPDILDNFDLDKTAVGIARRHGMPEEFIRPDREVKKIREERQAAQQKAALDQQLATAASVMDAGKRIEEGSPVDIMGKMTAQGG